ncbi:MAG: UDP-N-acetylglucosamine pyrophosphorylase [Promethearchaeota archaeon]|nr:MAG: UDP-N-acetylglucosamine pyrophosphorylase [Candidatus Lokiarchaeota archaeon]
MESNNNSLVNALLEKGVKIPNPYSIEVGKEVNIDQISGKDVVIHTGCKIFGKETVIMSGVKLGARSPVTIKDCQLGRNVELKGGYFEYSTFLDSANMGDGAEIRKGCLLEEKANGAHTVGLKQTILLPFVTLGSIVNFCDALMAGGTSRKNHSEVGSSYIHFNYTPNQDKATASLIGDVPHGVMLNQPPIFLGGQGGIVGPSRIGFNTVIAAGVIYRGDCPEGNKLLFNEGTPNEDKDFYPGIYWSVKRRVLNSIEYIANIVALRQWYINVRSKFYQQDGLEHLLYEGALDKLEIVFNERVKRFNQLATKMEESIEKYESIKGKKASKNLLLEKRELLENYENIEKVFRDTYSSSGDKEKKKEFLKALDNNIKENKSNYLQIIKNLDENTRNVGISWLSSIIEKIKDSAIRYLPSFT